LSTIHSENEQLVKKIVELDSSIRFGAISNRFGEIIAKFPREGVTLHLNEYETSKLLREASSSWHYRHQLSFKLGKGIFALAVYEKLIDNIPQLVENVHKLLENLNDS